MADQGLSPQTIKLYLAGLRNVQLSLGLPDPRQQSALLILKRVQAGISWSRLGAMASRVRLPVTSPLRQIRGNLEGSGHSDRLVIWAVCCTAFFGCFRLGDLLLESPSSFDRHRHMAWGGVAVDDQAKIQMVRVHLKQSKTDQFGRGADIVLSKTGKDLCPVATILAYIADRGA